MRVGHAFLALRQRWLCIRARSAGYFVQDGQRKFLKIKAISADEREGPYIWSGPLGKEVGQHDLRREAEGDPGPGSAGMDGDSKIEADDKYNTEHWKSC